MIIILKGFIGRGINGVCEIKVETNDKVNLNDSVITFEGEIKAMDGYFAGHPLSGKKKFTVKSENIICLIE